MNLPLIEQESAKLIELLVCHNYMLEDRDALVLDLLHEGKEGIRFYNLDDLIA